jgi:signal transduction histidine kinase
MLERPASEGTVRPYTKDTQSRATNLRLIRFFAVAALLVPLALFSFASWISYRDTAALTDERITRSLDVMQEQALKTFLSVTVALNAIDRLLGSRSPPEITANEPRLHEELVTIKQTLPDVQSIWIFGPDGRAVAISRESPPPNLSYSDNDYFTVTREHPDAPVYIGHIHESVSGGEPYFTLNRGRRDSGGNFAGVIEMSVRPSTFTRFYGQLTSSPGLGFAMVLEDGTMLARFPPLTQKAKLNPQSEFDLASIKSGGRPANAVSQLGRNDYRVGSRKLPGFPMYVTAFVPLAAMRMEWMTGMAMHLIFGIPATILLFATVLVILRRTQRLYAETDQRVAAEESLRQAQRLDAIGQLTGGVAHDFNNLLTIILGNLESAKRQLEQWTDAAHFKLSQRIDHAMHGAGRAASLTKRLLAFARQTPLRPSAIDVNRLLNGLSEFLQRALGEHIALEIVGAAGLWPAEADPAELETALVNIAVNARDAMPDGGKLTIETSNAYLDDLYCRGQPDIRPGQYVLIAVTDTGAGMSKHVVEHAFEPFFTTKESGQGTGLGLSQVYGFVRQLGGHVKIYSEVGEGTTVKMYLSRHPGDMPTAAHGGFSQPQRARAGECVLVVEDDPDVRGLCCRDFERTWL